MPIPKVRVGRLAPDQEALDYYDTEVKHWTGNAWDQLDMDKVDMGLHSDPTVGGTQAADRRLQTQALNGKAALGADETKDMRIHIGNELITRDAGQWHRPDYARDAILNSLMDDNWELGELFEETFPHGLMSRGSTIRGDQSALEDTAAMRQWLLDNDYQTITYNNMEEGADQAVDAALNSPGMKEYEASQVAQIKDLEMQAAAAERRGDMDLSEELDAQAVALDDELEFYKNDARREAMENNTSYISLDPGNVRSADAAFQKDAIGKPDMMGSATVPTMAGSAALGGLMSLAQNDDIRQGALDVGAGVLDSASRFGETIVNDALTVSQMFSNSLYDTMDTAPQVQFAPRTEAGNTLSEGIMNDVGSALESKGLFGEALGLPSGMDLIRGGMKLYNDEVKPYLSDRQEQAVGGTALLATMLGPPGKASMRDVAVDTASTRLGKQTPAANRRSMENQATRVREELAAEGGYETTGSAVDLQSLPVLSRSDLEGGVLMPTAGDMTMRGPLDKASGIDVDLDLQGGPGYGAELGSWESTEDIARSYQNKVQQVAEDTGTDKVFGTYSPMRLEAAGFSTMPAEVAARQMHALIQAGAQFDPAMIAKLDALVRKSGITDTNKVGNAAFPGMLSDELEEYLIQRGPTAVSARKSMLGEMSKASYRDAGFPLVEQIYRDVAYPELHGRDIGETGDLILRLDPDAEVGLGSDHRSYGTIIPGQGAGRLDGTIPFSDLYRDAWGELVGAMTESKLVKKGKNKGKWTTPRLLNQLEKTNSINWNKPKSKDARTRGYQLIDDELLDGMESRGLLRP